MPPGPRGALPFTITEVRHSARSLIVRFDDDRTAEEAGSLSGRWMLARESDLPVAHVGHDDFIGMTVIDAARGVLGTVTDLIVTGANDVLVVDGDAHGQVLIPVIDDVVRDVDTTTGVIGITALPGLIDEEPS